MAVIYVSAHKKIGFLSLCETIKENSTFRAKVLRLVVSFSLEASNSVQVISFRQSKKTVFSCALDWTTGNFSSRYYVSGVFVPEPADNFKRASSIRPHRNYMQISVWFI